MLSILLLVLLPSITYADLQYIYDGNGRVVEAIDGDGSSARYRYDAAGNIIAIDRYTASQLSIAAFTPARGPVSTSVAIQGTGFSPTPAQNTVKFNGTTATVSAATANRLTVAVPAGATTGLISVANASGTATSLQPYTVTKAPTITGFTPTSGSSGTSILINGTGFDLTAANNQVQFNGAVATVTSATATQLSAKVPGQVSSGRITVTTLGGTATSGADFSVLPSGIPSTDIISSARVTAGGASKNIALSTPYKYAVILFDGNSSTLQTVHFSNFNLANSGSAEYILYGPDNSVVVQGNIVSTDLSLHLPWLKAPGTYSLLISPSANTGSMTAKLVADTLLPINTTAVNGAITEPGQSQRLAFSGYLHQNLGFAITGAVLHTEGDTLNAFVQTPTNQRWNPGFCYPMPDGNCASNLSDLPMSGLYGIVIQSNNQSTATYSVRLTPDNAGALAVNGSTLSVALVPGQNAAITVAGAVGQALGLGVSNVVTTPDDGAGGLTLSLAKPDGTVAGYCYIEAPIGVAGGNSCDFGPLAETANYLLRVDPGGVHTANFKLTLSADATGALTTGVAKTFTTSRVGQNGRYTFTGVAGKSYSLLMTGNTFVGTTAITVYRPDGTVHSQTYLSYTSGATTPQTLDILAVPTAGTYTVAINPSGLSTGTISTTLRQDVSNTQAINGSANNISLASGQNATVTFTGAAGQSLGLGISNLVMTNDPSAYVNINIYDPADGLVITCYAGPAVGTPTGSSCDLPTLMMSGTYKMVVDPSYAFTASLSLILSTDITSALTSNGASKTFTTTRIGQNARYTFSGVAGESYALLLTGNNFAEWTTVNIYRPDGTYLASAQQYYDGVVAGVGTMDIRNLPESGTYTVLISPGGTAVGSITTALKKDVHDSQTIDGGVSNISLASGQNATITFEGAPGQALGLGISNLIMVNDPSAQVTLSLYAPDGTYLWACSMGPGSYSNTGSSCDFPLLPASGTYQLVVDPSGTYAASMAVTLSADISGALAANGAAQTFSTTRIGQNARYTFTAAAGQNYSLLFTGDTFADYTTVMVFSADGTPTTSANVYFDGTTPGIGTLDLRGLVAGPYTVSVSPSGLATGSMAVALKQDVSATLIVNAAASSLSLAAGQNATLTFNGTAGQNVGFGVTNLTTTPNDTSAQIYLTVFAPDLSVVVNCWIDRASGDMGGGSCDIPTLPLSGTYTTVVDPNSVYAATMSVLISNDVTGTLAVNGSAKTFTTTRIGQNARFTFAGTANQNYSLYFTGDNFPGTVYVTVLKPDGSYLTQTALTYSSGPAATGYLDVRNIPDTGTYTVLISPSGRSVGTINTALRQDVAAALAINGAVTNLSLTAAQNATLTFSGTEGQNLGLGISDLSMTPSSPNTYLYAQVFAPDGTYIFGCYAGSGVGAASGTSCDVQPLPATGNYQLVIDPGENYAATLKITLSTDVTDSLSLNGAAKTFTTSRIGQNARYTFAGSEGQSYTLAFSGDTFVGWTSILIIGPDGNGLIVGYVEYTSGTPSSGLLTIPALATSGTHAIFINPPGLSTGQMTLNLTQP